MEKQKLRKVDNSLLLSKSVISIESCQNLLKLMIMNRFS